MINVYDRTKVIYFDDGISTGYCCTWPVEIKDYEDYFIIETQATIDGVSRGWLGDVKFVLTGSGFDKTSCVPEKNISTEVIYKDVLCVRRIFDLASDGVASWQYTFNKY
jgi:hypothetical protein